MIEISLSITHACVPDIFRTFAGAAIGDGQ